MPCDQFQGTLKHKGNLVAKLTGNYVGYVNFDNVRYWDVRDCNPHPMISIEDELYKLESDSRRRPDLMSLEKDNVKEAQQYKE